MKLSEEKMLDIKIRILIKKARAKMISGYAYGLDELFGESEVNRLSDKEVKRLMSALDNHPLIFIDSEFPKKWSKQ